MSWGQITASKVAIADVETALGKSADAYRATLAASDYELDPAAVEQITAASAAAKALVESGAVGAGLVNVALNGHANPEHKPVAGWANDTITITVSCADAGPPATQ